MLDGQPVSGFESSKVRALLAYLAVEADSAHSRNALIGLLWPDRPERAARSNLSQALANLRQVIGDRQAKAPFLLISPSTIQFNRASDFSLDLSAFSALLLACDRHTHRRKDRCRSCLGRMEDALALYRGCFLEGFLVADCAAFQE
jgi:DNA-binding SARP family transcriptional activator